MPANECIPYKTLADTVTAKASGAVVGKRFVKIAADRTGGGGGGAEGASTVGVGLSTDLENLYVVAQCVAKDKAFGVAAWDAADKAETKVYVASHGNIIPITAGAAIAAGVEVEADAEGRAITFAAGTKLGMCLNKVTGAGKDAEILFY